MLRFPFFVCFFILHFYSLFSYQYPQEPQANYDNHPPRTYPQGSYPYPQYPNEDRQGDIADRASNAFEYNLYDRQQNKQDQANRNNQLQQQYYYQQTAGQNDNGTQYKRTRANRPQYFNPIDD